MRTPKAGFIVDDTMRRDQPYLWQRPKNGVYYVIYYTDPPNVQKRMESLKTRDRATAQDRLYIWRQEKLLERQTGIRRVGVPLFDAIKEYLTHHSKRYKPASTHRYKNALDNILRFVGKELPIGALQAKDLQDYQLHRIAKDRKPRTVDFELDVMRSFLNWARRRDWAKVNVADNEHVERLLSKKRHQSSTEKRIFTDEELKILLAPSDGMWWQYTYIFALLYYTGLRIGELSHLTVKDTSLPRREIRIREKTLRVPVLSRQLGKVISAEVHWTPKWYEERIVPIEDRLVPALEEFQKRRTENIYNLYFLGSLGTMITDHLSRAVKSLTDKTDVSVHTFRHTHISHALNRWGRHSTVVQKWVGHKHLATTEIYVHVSVEDLHREAKKVGD